jgi:hypothetical protein
VSQPVKWVESPSTSRGIHSASQNPAPHTAPLVLDKFTDDVALGTPGSRRPPRRAPFASAESKHLAFDRLGHTPTCRASASPRRSGSGRGREFTPHFHWSTHTSRSPRPQIHAPPPTVPPHPQPHPHSTHTVTKGPMLPNIPLISLFFVSALRNAGGRCCHRCERGGPRCAGRGSLWRDTEDGGSMVGLTDCVIPIY